MWQRLKRTIFLIFLITGLFFSFRARACSFRPSVLDIRFSCYQNFTLTIDHIEMGTPANHFRLFLLPGNHFLVLKQGAIIKYAGIVSISPCSEIDALLLPDNSLAFTVKETCKNEKPPEDSLPDLSFVQYLLKKTVIQNERVTLLKSFVFSSRPASGQLAILLESLVYETDRREVLLFSYPYIADPEHYRLALQGLKLSSIRREVMKALKLGDS